MENVSSENDIDGNTVVKYKYDAWGKCIVDSSTANIELANLNPFRYRSYYYDTETNLYFLKTRYYDPEIGRFITIDDISYLDPENINGLNLYAYCFNNPIEYIDNLGRYPIINRSEKIHTSRTIFESIFLHKIIGSFSVSRTITKSIEFNHGNKQGFLYLYHDLGYNDYDYVDAASSLPNSETYGVGVNFFEWLGIEVGANNNKNFFINAQITPWFQTGVQIGADGIGLNLYFGSNTTLDVSLNTGWGGIAIIAGAIACISAPYIAPYIATFFASLFESIRAFAW